MHHRTKKRTNYGPWVRWFGRTMLRLCGWRLEGEKPPVDKMVIVAAPHNTNWDLPFTLLAAMGFGIPAVFTIKDWWFFWPIGPIMYWCGGIPIDRSKSANTVGQLVEAFDESEKMFLVIPPEGTRKQVKYWKLGFYWIAVGANVPILLASIDYKKRVVCLADLVYPSGNFAQDFPKIREFYTKNVGYTPDYDASKLPMAEKVFLKAAEPACNATPST